MGVCRGCVFWWLSTRSTPYNPSHTLTPSHPFTSPQRHTFSHNLSAPPSHGLQDSNGVKQAWDSKSPLSIAAAIVWVITQLAKDKKDHVTLSQIVSVGS